RSMLGRRTRVMHSPYPTLFRSLKNDRLVARSETLMADAHARDHDYHLVDPSPWPVLTSVSLFLVAIGAVLWMHEGPWAAFAAGRSEEHTSELQSRENLVCRLLL